MLIELTVLGGVAYWLNRKQRKKQQITESVFLNQTTSNDFLSPLKNLGKNMTSALSGTQRKQQQLQLNPSLKAKMEETDRKNKRDLMYYTGIISVAVLGTIYPVFNIVGSLAALYLTLPVYLFLWEDLKAKRISPYLLDACLIPSMLFTGHILLVGIIGILGGLTRQLIKQTEEETYQQLVNIVDDNPSKVWIEQDDIEIQIDFEEIQVGDKVIINAGETIPIDGIIVQGLAIVDQHLLTGEAMPVEKALNDKVFAGTLLLSGRISVVVEIAGRNTIAAQIGQVLNNTHYYKDTIIARGRQIATYFTPISLGIAAITWPLIGSEASVATLWAPMGFNMIYLGPISVLIHLQLLSHHGILIKDGRVLESLHKIDTVVFDKTGILTLEVPVVDKIYVLESFDENTLLSYAATAEYRQSHPIAKAILAKAEEKGLKLSIPDVANYKVGYGIKVIVDNRKIFVGSARFMENEGITLPDTIQDICHQAKDESFSLVYVGIDNILSGILELHPSIRPEVIEVISYFKQSDINLYIISGDHEQPTHRIAKKLGIDHYYAEMLPENKADLIEQLKDDGKFVCFIGDGINDTIALKSAHVSISLCGASTAATDTAQVILMDGTLNRLKLLFQIVYQFEKNMQNNLLMSTIPGIVCIAGIYFLHFGIATAIGIKYASLAGGFVNTIWPLVTFQNTDSVP